MKIFNRTFKNLIKKRIINLKSQDNKFIKSFFLNIKNKILKKIIYNYKKIKKNPFNIYIYKEKNVISKLLI